MKKIIDYDLTISDFLADVNAWLNNRVPRDSTEEKAINDTKEMWKSVILDPRQYVRYDIMDTKVLGHTDGFIVKRDVNNFDNYMMYMVINIMTIMDRYYRSDNNSKKLESAKLELADAIKKYKMYRAKNEIARFLVSIKSPQRLLSTKQR